MKKAVIFALLMCVTVPLYGQKEGLVQPYDVLLRSAKVYIGLPDRDYDKIMELLNTAIANYPDPVEAHFLLGTIYSDKSQFKEMTEHFNKFEEIYARAKKEGDKKLVKICEKDKMPEQIRNTRLSALKKSFTEGFNYLKQSDSLSKVSDEKMDDSTRIKTVETLLEKARQSFEDCAMIDDTVFGVWTNLALISAKKGDIDKALQEYQRAYELNPKDPELLFAFASTLYRKQEYEQAAKYYGEFAERDSANAEAGLINQAMCFQAMKDEERLKGSLDKILQINPDNADVRYQRGVYFVRKASSKELQDSAKALDQLAEARPGDKSLEKAKSDLQAYRLSFYKLAFPDFKIAAELAKTDANYWYWYGSAAMLSDKVDEARTAYEKCVEINPEYKDCWCELERVFAKLQLTTEFERARANCGK